MREVPVECKWWGKISKSKAALWLHEMAFHGRGKFVCPYCQAKASYSHELIKHMRLEDHGTNRDISCPSCKISISQNEIVAHYEHCFKSEKKRKRSIEKIFRFVERSLRSLGNDRLYDRKIIVRSFYVRGWPGTYLIASEELFSLLASSANNDGNDKDEYKYKN